jgi:hypothetical protein
MRVTVRIGSGRAIGCCLKSFATAADGPTGWYLDAVVQATSYDRGASTLVGENGQLWQPHVRANVWRDCDAQATTTFGIDQVPLSDGLTTETNPRFSFYGQAGYQFAVSQSHDGAERNADGGQRCSW